MENENIDVEEYKNEKWSKISIDEKNIILDRFSPFMRIILDNVITTTKDFDLFLGSVIWDITGGKYHRNIMIKELWENTTIVSDVNLRFGIILESAKKFNINNSVARFVYSIIRNIDDFIEYIGPLYFSLRFIHHS